MTGRAWRTWTLSFLIVAGIAAPALQAQLVVKLSAQTVAEFNHYVTDVESQMKDRWEGKKNFLVIDDNKPEKERVLGGEVFIEQMNNGKPLSVKDGLIHDWRGAIFIPHTSVQRVVALLEDFDHHQDIYPEVSESHTLNRNGTSVRGVWRLKQKGLVPVILDVNEDVTYSQLSPGKWKGAAYARNITEVDTALFSRGKKFPLGEGHGYLWKLYGYWSLQAINGGVLAECRTLSLSRDIPQGLNWAVGPYVEKQPRESLTSTLENTRKAAQK